jgi:tetratricopeptide (TPR) repeat protein
MINVGVYSAREADAYLRERLGPFLDQLPGQAFQEAGRLAADLGRLPLGLAQAAAVIIDQAISCAEYRRWFADRGRRIEELFPADPDTDGYTKTVATSWALAIDAANQLTPVGLAKPMAYLVAVLDPTGAPEAVYTSQTTRSYLAAMTEQEEVAAASARGALRALHRLSLITHNPNPTEARAVRMHNLTERAVLKTVDAEEVAGLVRVAADALVESWPDIESRPPLAEALRANTAALSAVHGDALLDRETGGHPVLLRSGRSLAEVGLVTQAIAYYSGLCDQAERVLGPDHHDTLICRDNLALAYRSAGDLRRAIPLLEQNLTDSKRILGPDHSNTLTPRGNLADAYRSAGDLGRAIRLDEQNLTDSERILGPDHPDTLGSRNNLAEAYRSAGDLGRAIPLFEQNLTDSERIFGPDHPHTLTSRGNLASAYDSAGDVGRAIPLYEQTLADAERILGPDHPNILGSRNGLAYGYFSAGDLRRATLLFEQTLTDRERILGPDHPDTLTSRGNLASVYESAGDLEQAIPLYEQTLADAERILGPDHPDTLGSRNNLAYGYFSAGGLGQATQLFEQTLTDSERIMGPNHPDTLGSRNNLASAYRSAGDLGRAIPLFEQNLTDSERIFGPDHPDTLTYRNNLVNAYQAAGRPDETAWVRSDSPPENGDRSPAG